MVRRMLIALWNILLELAPWLILGALAAGILRVVVPAETLRKHLSGRLGVLKAVAFGIPLPLCSCGVIPVGLGLRKSGASRGAAVGFLISTPQTGVDSILVSGGFLGWPFAFLKVVVALVTGLLGGTLADAVQGADSVTAESETRRVETGGPLRRMMEHALELIRSIWGWLVIGIIVSATITWLVPENSLSETPVLTGLSALLITLLISLPLYVCATASVPIAAALVAGGLPPGAALVFLMAGPATNVATLGAVYRALGGRTLAVYLTTIVLGSLGAGMMFNDLVAPSTNHLHAHEHVTSWWRVGSAVVLGAIVLRFAFADLERWLRTLTTPPGDDAALTVHISGMTCEGCVGRLRRDLEAHPEINHADVSLAAGTAVVQGSVSEESVRRVIRTSGFEVGPEDHQVVVAGKKDQCSAG